MFAVIASGVTVGLGSAVIMWNGGHTTITVLFAYALTGMIGTIGSAAWVARPQRANRL